MRLIQSVAEAKQLVNIINTAYSMSESTLVLGLDCEGLVKGRPLSLIQISVGSDVYIIDLLQVNPFVYGLQEIMESPYIIKVFHDFWEDASALVNNYGVYCQRVFDTQIAHRLFTEYSRQDGAKTDYSQNNVGLNDLLKRYLNKMNTCKDFIQSKMKENKYFWDIRPLTEEMIKYAGQDVLYLPYLYQTSCFLFDEIGSEMPDIFGEASKCNEYATMNNGVTSITKGDVIQAFIKNIQDFGIYCSLNVGFWGFISHKQSKEFIVENYNIGDIIDVTIMKVDTHSNRAFLKFYNIEYESNYGGYNGEESNLEYEYYDDYPDMGEYQNYQDYQDVSFYDQYQQQLQFDLNQDVQFQYTQANTYDNKLQNYSENYIDPNTFSPDLNNQAYFGQIGKLDKESPEFK